ncbi:MAG: alanine--tRNA ligase [Patescibacteria group bacterium]
MIMRASELRKLFLQYFEKKGHKVIPSASLVPENDPTVLFTTAGMHPLVPFLIGENHPEGKRLVNAQRCIRTDDIDEVGDKIHHTFFEMLGNWSLGDYFKDEAIEMSFEFLTSPEWLNIDKSKFAVSVFVGDDDAPFDQEAYDKWISLGIDPKRIAKLPKKNNWWGPAGETGPCGPDTEMFYWTGEGEVPKIFQETCDDPDWVEIWNDVFMQYDKTSEGKFEILKQKNVDTGMGFERTLAVMNGLDDNYRTDLFLPIIEKIEEISGKKYNDNEKEFRIIADHIKAAVFAINDGVLPSNKGAGYVVRRLIRRAIVKGQQLGIKDNFTSRLADVVFGIYDRVYYSSSVSEKSDSSRQVSNNKKNDIKKELEKEEAKFRKTLQEGLKIIEEKKEVSGKILFDLYQSFGLPLEISIEEFKHKNIDVNDEAIQQYNNMLEEHKQLSRTASAGMFKGGLADDGEIAVKYHTATHLLHQALRQVLGEHVQQKGSNINSERLRFDFTHTDKMTPEQISEVENIVNEQIEKDLSVTMEEMSPEEAKKQGALGFFEHKYGDKVKVYTIGSADDYFSREICGGPHVENIGTLGHFKIKKEESSSAGVRRIKAVLE